MGATIEIDCNDDGTFSVSLESADSEASEDQGQAGSGQSGTSAASAASPMPPGASSSNGSGDSGAQTADNIDDALALAKQLYEQSQGNDSGPDMTQGDGNAPLSQADAGTVWSQMAKQKMKAKAKVAAGM